MKLRSIVCVLLLAGIQGACEGDQGPAGPMGDPGPSGADGPPGSPGQDGFTTLIQTMTFEANDVCAAGGVQLDIGLDNGNGGETAGDGVLGPGEIDRTEFICNGTSSAPPGTASLVFQLASALTGLGPDVTGTPLSLEGVEDSFEPTAEPVQF
ncbi:MAG: hypothetical protein ACFB9M_09430 [Myxococcota bacterium]